ncbi:MAG: DEAD/DEAH box helicase, partial [Dongiaceae bacterium]
LGIAQTGTGKTAAFVLPMLERLLADRTPVKPRTCRNLILAPTRELAQQIAEAIKVYGKNLHPSVAVVVGGVRPGPQIRQLSRGVDVVVATPGRLLDHVGTNALRLNEAQVVVLDEADQMLDLGFIPAIRRILAQIPAQRQTMLFSATMPDAIRKLAADFLRSPQEIRVTPAAKPVDAVEQSVILVDSSGKRSMLARLLGQTDVKRAIVFTRTKHGADRVTKHLENDGISAVAIHGNKSQPQRERALEDFRSNRIKVLVATDIAARGIDVDGITHVVNYELPNVPESYVHRIGRTARAGASGIAVAFCDPAERGMLRDIERLIGRTLPKQSPNGTAIAVDAEPIGRMPARGPREGSRGRNAGPRHENGRHENGRGGKPNGSSRGKPAGKSAGRGNPRHEGGRDRHADAIQGDARPVDARREDNAGRGPKRNPHRADPAKGGRTEQANGHRRNAHAPHGKDRNETRSGNGERRRDDHRRDDRRDNHHGEARPGNEAEDAGLARMLGAQANGPRSGNEPRRRRAA